MRVVVTGANGLIGRHFIEHCAGDYEITALTRNKITPEQCSDKVTWVSTDYSYGSLMNICRGIDAILHLASVRPYSTGSCYLENTKLDYLVYKVAADLGIDNVTSISSRTVYGNMPIPWKESEEVAPLSDYSLSKVVSEINAKYFNEKFNMKIKVLRLAQVFSHDEFNGGLLNVFFNNAKNNKPLEVSVKGVSREYIYIKDVVSSLSSSIMDKENSGIFNLGTGEVNSIEGIAENICLVFGKPYLFSIKENRKIVVENSLMDSSNFYDTFDWKPGYSIKMAIEDIYVNFYCD